MIAVDTNILIYAHRTETSKHAQALSWLNRLANGETPWGIPVFCLSEFLRVATHRRIFTPPSTLDEALGAIAALLESPGVRVLNPGPYFFSHLSKILREGEASGNLVMNAQIAAVCREHGIDTILTEDRDFLRFPGFRFLNLSHDPAGR